MSPNHQTVDAEFSGAVQLCGDRLTTTSRDVARHFGKEHKNVLRIIDEMRDSKHPEIAQHQRLNFEPLTFDVVVGKGAARKLQGYLMTQDGLTELAMSFTGEQARLVRIRFIAAFHAMAERLKRYETSIYARMLEHEREDNFRKGRASIGSMSMLERKKALPGLRRGETELKEQGPARLVPTGRSHQQQDRMRVQGSLPPQGQQQLALPMDNLTRTRHPVARQLLELEERLDTEERTILITENDPATAQEIDARQ